MKRNTKPKFRLQLALLGVALAGLVIAFLLPSCERDHRAELSADDYLALEDIAVRAIAADKADSLYAAFRNENNKYGEIVLLRMWGDTLRNEGCYDDALLRHDMSRQITEEVGDTVEWVRALNDMGADYLRMGSLEMAQRYHYAALSIGRYYSDTSSVVRASMGEALEGLADVYMLVGKSGQSDSLASRAILDGMINTCVLIDKYLQEEEAKEEVAVRNEMRSKMRGELVALGVLVALLLAFIGMILYYDRRRMLTYAAMKRLNHLREDFFANITHEFRTPLTVILGLSRDMQKEDVELEEMQDMAKSVERQSRGLYDLVSQLLDIAKVKSSLGNVDWRHGDLAVYMNMVTDSYRDLARHKGIDIVFNADSEGVVTDFVPDYINKMVGNLLSNAIKFTESSGKVEVSVAEVDDMLIIKVSDTGRGIPEESLAHVFEPFYQARQGGYAVGTGVSLSLVAQIVCSLKGTIKVNSELGKGTEFVIVLPVRNGKNVPLIDSSAESLPAVESDESASPAEVTNRDNGLVDGVRALIVEDNKDVAAYIGRQISQEYSVFYADNGLKGLDVAREIVPDIIITDLTMPEMDGLQFCRAIRSDSVTSHIPIVVVSAKVSRLDKIKGFKSGADAYLTKPFDGDELRVMVESLIRQRRILMKKYSAGAEDGSAVLYDDKNKMFIDKVVASVESLLEAHQPIDVNIVASMVCMSYIQFYRKISAVTGYTPAQYIQFIKVDKAKKLLAASPDKNLNEIAELSGFNDYSNFVRAFRKVTGDTPSRFIKQSDS